MRIPAAILTAIAFTNAQPCAEQTTDQVSQSWIAEVPEEQTEGLPPWIAEVTEVPRTEPVKRHGAMDCAACGRG